MCSVQLFMKRVVHAAVLEVLQALCSLARVVETWLATNILKMMLRHVTQPERS